MLIFITGFMGAGKSYLGKVLARQLRFDFVDLDELIEAKMLMPISTIFEQQGEAGFRRVEAECLRSLAGKTDLVVATGGGTPCFLNNLAWMNVSGFTIYFSASTNLLAKRLLSAKSKRPLLTSLNDDELEGFIKMKLAERTSFYGQCHLQFNVPEVGTEGIDELSSYLSKVLT